MADETVVFDFAHTHVFKGFGVHAWIGSPHYRERDALLRALNARFVRASLPGLVPPEQLPAHAGVDDISGLIARNRSAATDAAVERFRDELRSLNIRLHLIFWDVPAPWRAEGGGGHLAVSEHVADYANWLVAHLLYATQMGLAPVAVELTNEPNGVWNTQFTPAQYDRLVADTRAAMDRAGLQGLQIEGPGVSNRPGDFLRELTRTGHVSLLGAISYHEYDTKSGAEPAGLRALAPSLSGLHDPDINVTEFSSDAPKWHLPPYAAGADHRGNPASGSRDFAVSVVGEALQLIADGAEELMFWQLEDLSWQKGRTGLLDIEGRVKPAAQALSAVFGLVHPGSEVARSSHLSAETPFVAFLNQNQVTVCAANLSDTEIAVAIRFMPPYDVHIERHLSFSALATNDAEPALAMMAQYGDGLVTHLSRRTFFAAQLAAERKFPVEPQ
jgi:hypothetical protein